MKICLEGRDLSKGYIRPFRRGINHVDIQLFAEMIEKSGYEKNEPDPMSPIRKNQTFLLKNLIIDEKITTNKLPVVLNLDMLCTSNEKEIRKTCQEYKMEYTRTIGILLPL